MFTSAHHAPARDIVSVAVDALNRGDPDQALALLTPVMTQPGADPRAFEYATLAARALGDAKTANLLLGIGLKRNPDNPYLHSLAGRLAMEAGDRNRAQTCFEAARRLDPGHLPALTALTMLAPGETDGKLAKALRRASKARKLSVKERAAVHHALARIEDAVGRPATAFFHWRRANQIMRKQHDPKALVRLVDGQIAHFTADGPTPVGQAPIVFIGGMPRSGTTLVETALSKHPDVRSMGETPLLLSLLTKARQTCGGGAWDWLTQLPPEAWADLRAEFDAHAESFRKDATVLIEKLPLNCLHFGFAQRLLPEARYIYMDRHPLDCGLSNYATQFETSNPFATRLDWIGTQLREVQRSATDYAEKLGALFRWQSYRALIDAPEQELRALVAHLGLAWDPEVLTPETNEAAQRTASLLQVKAPINRKGLDKWHRYATHLAPLKEALGGDAWLSDWDAAEAARLGDHVPIDFGGIHA